MPPIHNHYVPQAYLKGFATADGKIFMYFKTQEKVIHTSLFNVANELHYWSDEIETFLANEVEEPANPVIEKLRQKQPISVDEKFLLSCYMITMVKRTPKGQARMRELFPTAFNRSSEKARNYYEQLRTRHPEMEEFAKEQLNTLETLSHDIISEIQQSTWERILAPDMTPESAEAIAKMRWSIAIAGKKKGFVTTDNPVIFTQRTGIKPPHGQVLFPISTKAALWATWRTDVPIGYFNVNDDFVDEANTWLIKDALKYVFYQSHKNWIETALRNLRKRSEHDQTS